MRLQRRCKSLELIKKEEEEKRVRLTLSNRVRPMGKEISIIKQFTKEKGNDKQTDGNPKLNENKNEWEISTQQSAVVVVPVQKQKSAWLSFHYQQMKCCCCY